MQIFKAAAAVVVCAFLTACGGGGSGGNAGATGGGGNGHGGGTLSVTTGSLTFNANGPTDATPAPLTVSGSVMGFSGGTLYISIVGTGNAIASISPVSLVDNTTGQATVSVPAPSSLGVGTYTGVITVRACTTDVNCANGNLPGSPQTINVTYNVGALKSTATSFDYTVNNAPAAGDLTQQTTITGVPVQNWTATTDVTWLSVTANGGNGTAMNAALVPSVVDGLTNGTYTGSVTVKPGTAGQALTIPVSLTVGRTQINYVSPYVAYTGTSNNVIIRGEEFSQVTIQNVLFGTTPAQWFTVVSPTEIDAQYPSTLTPGRYTVGLQSNFTGVRQFANLVVVAPPTFAATALPYPSSQQGAAEAIVYDAERAALGVTGATAFIHFPSIANVWQAPTAKPLVNSFGLALSADGTEWIAGAGKSVVHINANDLSTVATVVSPLFGSGVENIANLAVANDGTIAMFGDVYTNCGADLMLYNVRKHTFTTPGYKPCRGTVGASGDGSRLLIPNQFTTMSTDDVFSLDTSTGATTPTGIHLLTGIAPALDRTASRIVLNKTAVYDGSYNYLGNLPATTDAVVLSPDGTRAYTFDHSGTLMTYDLTGALVAGIYPQIGAPITLAGNPGPTSTGTVAIYSNAVVVMTITPDGGTVFIAGSNAVIVQPTH